MTGTLWAYTIYDRPADLPGAQFAVRAFAIGAGRVAPGVLVGVADTLAAARALVPPSADALLARQPEDDPVIVETWM